MTKAELVAQIADNTNDEHDEVERFLNSFIHVTTNQLATGDIVHVGDLGIFSVRHEGEHQTHVPGQEELVDVPAQVRVLFHPGKAMRDELNAASTE